MHLEKNPSDRIIRAATATATTRPRGWIGWGGGRAARFGGGRGVRQGGQPSRDSRSVLQSGRVRASLWLRVDRVRSEFLVHVL